MPNNQPTSAISFALKLLSLRNHSQHELERKLLKKGYPLENIKSVMEKLAAEGILDDKKFSMELIRSRSKRKPSGKLILTAELKKRGVSDTITQELLNGYASAELCHNAAQKKIASLHGVTECDQKKKLVTFLRNRGFGWQEIQAVLKNIFGSSPENEEPFQEISP